MDILGGRDASTQTISHCGLLPTSSRSYTDSPVLVSMVQQKLGKLGYYHAAPSGRYDKTSRKAVTHFQHDYGLKADGVVGPMTAQRLAFESHPNPNVRRCFRMASGI